MKQIPVPTQSWTFLPPKLSKNINGGERESAQVQEAGPGSLEPAGRPLLACDASSFAEKKPDGGAAVGPGPGMRHASGSWGRVVAADRGKTGRPRSAWVPLLCPSRGLGEGRDGGAWCLTGQEAS